MLKRWALVSISGIIILSGFGFAQDIPEPAGWVNDFAGVISPEYRDRISALIQELEEKTSSEVAVVTIDSVAPYDEKTYARALFDNWKPGKKGKDNGVLVLLAIKERRWRIEVGYGLEGTLPDGLCGEIGRKYMVPYFKEAKFGEGLYYGVAAIAKEIAEDANVTIGGLGNAKFKESYQDEFLIFIFITLIVLIFIVSVTIQSRGYYYGSGTYGGGGLGGGGFGGGGFGGGGFGGGGGGGGGAGGGF